MVMLLNSMPPNWRRRATAFISTAGRGAVSIRASRTPPASPGGWPADWVAALELDVERRLARGETGLMDALGRQFERALIGKALARTGGRRIEAANLLGMGRNTITRKIQDLGIDAESGE